MRNKKEKNDREFKKKLKNELKEVGDSEREKKGKIR